jgi:hypothetical protein
MMRTLRKDQDVFTPSTSAKPIADVPVGPSATVDCGSVDDVSARREVRFDEVLGEVSAALGK